ncbi:unnamed protein product [Cladocopium goreaui]|uniref:Cytosine-specific methyltransferase n=1 Tax=Cladocopium goreaui TaxID=2562237 RepID=A0A9P1GG39_9DINO|nr:unnamed protein product [Cladocopium goreaui]CAI4009342.1 unnamed protein product [Cladocopium goreaui]
MPKLVIAEDCAGLGPLAPCLKQLGFKVEAFYMSESDPALLQRLSDLYHPQKLSDDCTKYKGVEKLINVFGSGPPCQPFSPIGQRRGHKDVRAKIGKAVVMRIRRWLPETFILENVKALTYRKNRKHFAKLLRLLKADGYYDVQWKVLDTWNYGGLPQRRSRVWIIGTTIHATKRKFRFPKPLPKRKRTKLMDLLGRKSQEYQFPKTAGGRKRLRAGLKKINKLGGDLDEPWCSVRSSIAELRKSSKESQVVVWCLASPVLELVLTLFGRRAMEGWSTSAKDVGDLSVRQFGMALGNAWPIPVAVRILHQLDRAMGWSG